MRFLFFLLFIPILSFAQEKKIQGILLDELQQSVADATVQIIQLSNKNEILNTKSDNNGRFNLNISQKDSMLLRISHINFLIYEELLNINASDSLIIQLTRKSEGIEEITVVGKRPQVDRKIDRLIFDVQNSNISSLNTWDILKRTPLVRINGSTISVKGSSNIIIMINDKRVMMSGEELKTLLESNQGNDIKSIEVITNPPAKYEASGSAIINIVMTQNYLFGYRGSLFTKYEQSNFGKQLIGLSNYFKNEKWNLNASYYFGRGTYARYGIDVVNYPNDNSRWESEMTRIDTNNSQHSYSVGVDYNADSTLAFTFGLNGSYSPNSFGVYQVPTIIYSQENLPISNYHTSNDHNRYSLNTNAYFQVNKKINKDLKIDWSNYFSQSTRNHYQDILTLLNFQNQPKDTTHFITDNSYKTKLFSSQVDVNHSLKGINLEYGGKYSYVQSTNRMDFRENVFGLVQTNPDKSSEFDYFEQNLAGYGSLSYKYKSWQWKGGLRAEYTRLEGRVSTPFEMNRNQYFTLFPTFYIQYSTQQDEQIGFSYGKRINRPSYSWLNPAKSYYNQFSYFQGDPRLRATIAHNLNATYTKNNWNIELFYSYEKWPNMEVSFQNNETNEVVYQYTNIKHGQTAGLSIIKSLELTDFWTVNLDFTGLYNDNYFEGIDKELYKNEVFSFDSRIVTNFALQKKSDWNLEISNYYYSPSIQGPFRISSFSSTDLIMNRKFSKKKFELSLYFLDIFKTQDTKVWSKYADQDNYFLDYQDSRKFGVTLRYNFGNQSIKNGKSINKTEEQRRM